MRQSTGEGTADAAVRFDGLSDALATGLPAERPRRPTIHDVAREAGVSYGTVSRYLNGGKWVGEASTQAVVAAIEKTGYRANRFARSLATGKSSTVVFLLTEPQDRLFGDPNYPVILRAATEALDERDMSLILMTASTDHERRRALEFVSGGHVAGVLLISSHAGDPILPELVAAGVPTVSCGRPSSWEHAISSVAADDRIGAREAVAHLASTGRRRIGIITGPLDLAGSLDRVDGYYDALDAAGIARDERLVVEGDWSNAGGRAGASRLLEAVPDLDAVFASNDVMAVGAVASLRAAGRSIPEDVGVVGFDDAGQAATCDPPLSTVRQPFAEISREMVRLLVESEPGHTTNVRVSTELVIRESSARQYSHPTPLINQARSTERGH
ncbi:LacI family DNA-binding transcriptional regulator [Cellulomonas sp. McL0617]|uniref:LacI family DNA-binding transcriptional regulator n=1 Tax=Cellulomonas sp. McL0617 TaxID=3415675 RepID=UPI003CF28B9C